jgi:hypothetical protein
VTRRVRFGLGVTEATVEVNDMRPAGQDVENELPQGWPLDISHTIAAVAPPGAGSSRGLNPWPLSQVAMHSSTGP